MVYDFIRGESAEIWITKSPAKSAPGRIRVDGRSRFTEH